MAIQKQLVLRYRGKGHLRFDVPAAMRQDDAAAAVESELASIPGVYRLTLHRRAGKLSIRFVEESTPMRALVLELAARLERLEKRGVFKSVAKSRRASAQPRTESRSEGGLGGWARGKINEAKETLQAMKIMARFAGGERAARIMRNPERAAIEFANDVLVFYLIKVHWHRITQLWLPHPILHRYEWIATIYITYLWVRWRHGKS